MGAVVGYVNHADAATLSTTTSGSMLRPLSELKLPWARGLCRGPANGTDSQPAQLVIRADLGGLKRIHMIGVVGLNAVSKVEGVVRLSGISAGGSEVAQIDLLWSAGWGEQSGQAVWAMTDPSSIVEARHVQIELDVFGRPSGERYVDARRLLIMEGTRIAAGWDSDWSIQQVDLSASSVTPRGGVFVDEQGAYRIMNFGVSGMTRAEAWIDDPARYALNSLLSTARGRHEVVACPRYYDDPTEQDLFRYTVYGRLASWSPIQHTKGDTYACESIQIAETPYPPLS